MPIVGFYIKSISAFRKDVPKGRIDINSTPQIVSIDKSSIGLKKKEDALEIGFEFITKYEPDVGEIKIAGNVMYIGDKIKNVLSVWKKEKNIQKEVEIEIKNFLFRKCMILGINLSEQMNLPPPLMFPRMYITKKEVDMRYIG